MSEYFVSLLQGPPGFGEGVTPLSNLPVKIYLHLFQVPLSATPGDHSSPLGVV